MSFLFDIENNNNLKLQIFTVTGTNTYSHDDKKTENNSAGYLVEVVTS
jgi:hypothetical protein